MGRKRKANRNRTAPAATTSNYGDRELIIMASPGAPLADGAREILETGKKLSRSAPSLLKSVVIKPLFGPSEERIRARMAELPASADAPDLTQFYEVQAPDEKLDELADTLRRFEEVEAAYVKPKGEPPVERPLTAGLLNDMAPSVEEAPSQTPDFSGRQGYLDRAPRGIDARFAWGVRGGRGGNVRIIDCEWGWRFGHEDLSQLQGGVVVGSGSADDNHGTAVLGEFSGDQNQFGVLGICPEAHVSAASFATEPTASAIRQAADRLRPGDILLLEIHRPGPDANGFGQDGFIAIEWWPDDFAAIRYAVSRGVIVVEAAGNGARNLDAAVFEQRPAGFPASWRNPFNPANPSSGAVVVGAGAPPPGTHGRDHGPDRSRLDFSNHGRRVDVQGWGREVTSTGYGDLQGGTNRDLWYTDQFSGTSSASPIVVGALGCVQGILRAAGRPLLQSEQARQVLRLTGSPQQDGPGRPRTQRIGNRPDLRQLIPHVFGVSPEHTSDLANDGGNGIDAIQNGRVVINCNLPHVTVNINDTSPARTLTFSREPETVSGKS